MGSRNILALVVVLVLLLLAGWWFLNSQRNNLSTEPTVTTTPQETIILPSPSSQQSSTSAVMEEKATATIDVSDTSVNPKTVTIKAGESVAWMNSGKEDHQINSAIHPTHLVYPPLNTIGLLKPGEEKSLSFPDKGTYKFHDHLNPSLIGSVIVE